MLREFNGNSYNPPYNISTATFSPGSTETILNSVLIPAFTIGPYDILGIQTRVVKLTTLSGPTIRIRISSGLTTSVVDPSSGLTTQAAIYTVTATSSNYIPLDRRVSIQSSTDTRLYPTTVSSPTDIGLSSTTGMDSLNINWQINNYIIVTATSSVGEVLNCGYIVTDLIEGIPPS